ncbi:hypothetical protein DXG03_008713 [Asterophora parasitica]|uniref:Uncharacterized protein n=1 Tax=Asterophora parasitica TaxID=117018 RepID=A0A9P7KCW5_9AGAR|nr:hypothetical protein DXG03_008713 [Asterophora parasitica]
MFDTITAFWASSPSSSPDKTTKSQAPLKTSNDHKDHKRRERDALIDNHPVFVENISSGHGSAAEGLNDVPLVSGATSYSQALAKAHQSSVMEEPRHRERRESLPTERDTHSRARHGHNDASNLRRIEKVERMYGKLQWDLEDVQREKNDWRERATELQRELESVHRREADIKLHCQRHTHEISVLKDELYRAAEHHEITRTQLLERTAELQSAQLFFSQADSLSGAEVIAIARALNAEILQSAAFMADALDYTEGRSLSPEELSIRKAVLGEDLFQALLSRKGQEEDDPDPTLVQLALQVCLVDCCKMILESWTLTGSGQESFLKDIYAEIISREKQSTAGRWRSMLHSHATNRDALSSWLSWIIRSTEGVLRLAGWSESKTPPGYLRERLSVITTLAFRLRTAIWEKVTSMDIIPYTIEKGSNFNPEFMDDTYAEGRGPARSNMGERIAGSTELGLLSRIKGDQGMREGILLKPKVILCAALREEF